MARTRPESTWSILPHVDVLCPPSRSHTAACLNFKAPNLHPAYAEVLQYAEVHPLLKLNKERKFKLVLISSQEIQLQVNQPYTVQKPSTAYNVIRDENFSLHVRKNTSGDNILKKSAEFVFYHQVKL